MVTPRSERTAAIQTRLDAATPGPWAVGWTGVTQSFDRAEQTGEHSWDRVGIVPAEHVRDEDAALIANAPTDLRYLLDRLVSAEARITKVEEFLDTVHGLNEMNVVRGLRKVLAGQESNFSHEVRLHVYGEWCGHEGTPQHYPKGYGLCADCAALTEGATDV